jgi:hypothetical protein
MNKIFRSNGAREAGQGRYEVMQVAVMPTRNVVGRYMIDGRALDGWPALNTAIDAA